MKKVGKKVLKKFEDKMIDQQEDLEPPMDLKKASAKLLLDYGYTERSVATITGLGAGTVDRTKNIDISEIDPVVWSMAEQAVKKLLSVKRDLLSAKVLSQMEAKIDEGKAPLGSLAFVYKVLREADVPKNAGTTNTTNIQVKVVREQTDSNDKVLVEAK